MDSDSDPNKIRSEKRKLSESEHESDNCKKAHLDSDVTSTTPSTEDGSLVTSTTTLAEDGSLLPKSSSPVPVDSLATKESPSSSIIDINEQKGEKEISVSVIEPREQDVKYNDADMKDKENSETSSLLTDNSSANFIEQSKDVSDTITDNEETAKFPSNKILIIDKEKMEKTASASEIEKTVQLGTEDISSGNDKDSKKLISLTGDLGTSISQEENSVTAELGTCIPHEVSSATADLGRSLSLEANSTTAEPETSISPDADSATAELGTSISLEANSATTELGTSISPDADSSTAELVTSISPEANAVTAELEASISQEENSALDKEESEKSEDIKDKKEKELSPEVSSNATPVVSNECKESPSFEGTLKNISPISNIIAESDVNDKKCIVSTIIETPLNAEATFVPIPQSETSTSLCNELEAELDKKSEISAMEVESNNHTPVEGSLVETPCDSGETSPSTSTPADSCQASAAPSPLLKEDPAVSESLLDDSSMDTKDIPDENEEDKELANVRPVRFGRRRKKTIAQKYKKGKKKSTPMLVDEETRMSATGTPDLALDEDSQSSVGTSSKKETRRYKSEVIVPESTEVFTAEKVFEYIWPLEGLNGEHYFIQEHISQYLGISSFKRRYPDLRRRPIESQEKEYLKDLGLVTEIACDLGLTAVRSEDMLDIMFSDFPGKYEELQRVLREKKENQLKEKGKVEYQVVNLDKSKMKEYSRKAALNASKWNVAFNRERHEERRYSFDLQTFSLHIPISRAVKLPPQATKLGSYPIAVLPGQYTDYCKIYSSNELKGMPLQSVLSGPFTAEELAAEVQEDSDDDISAVASVGTCPEFKEEPETSLPIDPLSPEKQPRCKVCNGGRGRNKDGKPEPLIICGTCRTPSHPTCIDLTLAMITKIESYSWQCMDCKTCAQCNDPDDEERMIFCDMCDRGYHIYCVGLRKVPNGRWHCKECAVCFTCGSRNPSGNEHIKNAEWQHEFKKDKDNKQLRYACTLCLPCDKYWKRRQFCSVCMKVYRSIPEDGMVRCLGCPKYVHKDGCSILQDNERFCNYCYKSRNSTALTHSRIIAAAKKKMATGSPMWK